MSGSGGDSFAHLTIDPIFDDAIYYSEALLLPAHENEDDMDHQLAILAQLSGIENPCSFFDSKTPGISTSLSTMSVKSEQGSDASIRSQETQSTGFTSQPSRRESRDNTTLQQLPTLRSPPVLARASFSLDHAVYLSDCKSSSMRHRHSTSAFSVPNSIHSESSSSRPTTARSKLKRGSGLFSRFKKGSSCACTSKFHQGHSSRPLTRKLECGHALSRSALQAHVQDAMDSKEKRIPTCCGISLPRDVLQMVFTAEDVDVVIHSALPSPDVGSLRDSGYSEDGISSIELPSLEHIAFSAIPTIAQRDLSQMDENIVNLLMANEAFKSLKKEQNEQFQRVALFESNQRKALAAHHQWSLQRLSAQLECTKVERVKQHPHEVERLEDFQLNVEHDLCKAHVTETQNVALALKHMTAYCLGVNPMDQSLAHAVTKEDREKLERKRLDQNKLPAKHESAINVLRARQERDLKNKLQKQKRELQQLDSDYEKDRKAEELQYMRDTERLDAMIHARRRRTMNRWELRFEVWRKDWENQHEMTLPGRLPHEDWPEITDDVEASISATSSLARYATQLCS